MHVKFNRYRTLEHQKVMHAPTHVVLFLIDARQYPNQKVFYCMFYDFMKFFRLRPNFRRLYKPGVFYYEKHQVSTAGKLLSKRFNKKKS